MVNHMPPKDPEYLTNAYQEFHFQYGVTLGRWAALEDFLCSLFCDLCGFNPDAAIGPALFFSGRSFATRVDLLTAATRSSAIDDEIKEVVRAILKKARRYSAARNAIAHGAPEHFVEAGKEYQGWRIKEPERRWEMGGIGIEQLKEAEQSFIALAGICWEMTGDLIRPKTRRKKRLKPPSWYLEQVRELPNDAYHPEEDQIP